MLLRWVELNLHLLNVNDRLECEKNIKVVREYINRFYDYDTKTKAKIIIMFIVKNVLEIGLLKGIFDDIFDLISVVKHPYNNNITSALYTRLCKEQKYILLQLILLRGFLYYIFKRIHWVWVLE